MVRQILLAIFRAIPTVRKRRSTTHQSELLSFDRLDDRRLLAGDGLVASSSGKLWFSGTDGPDQVSFFVGVESHELDINGVTTSIPADQFDDIRIRLHNDDAIEVVGIEGVEERFKSWDGKSVFTSQDFDLTVYGSGKTTAVSSGEESDRAYLYGTDVDEHLQGSPTDILFYRPDSQQQVLGFDRVYVYGNAGIDTVELEDGVGADKFSSFENYDILDSPESYLKMQDFESVEIEAVNGGADRAYQWDTPGNDFLLMSEDHIKLVSDFKTTSISGFERSYAYSTAGGHDHLKVYDSVFTDAFEIDSAFKSAGKKNGYEATPSHVRFFGDNFYRRAEDFEVEDVVEVNPRGLAGRFSNTGAVSINMDWEAGERNDFFIEQQRRGTDLIMSGLGIDNDHLTNLGIKMIQWGIDQQTVDGDFSESADELHSITMFMHAVGLALVELDRYEYDYFDSEMREQWIISLDHMSDWVLRHQNDHADVNLDPYSHRYFLRSLGFRYANHFTGNLVYLQESDRYFDEAIIRLTEDSIMPELGRFDLNYQTLGLRYASDFAHLNPGEDRIEAIRNLFVVSLNVILPRIDSEGLADLRDSSRTGELDREGNVKKFDYRNAVRAYYGGYELTRDESYLVIANNVFQHDSSIANILLEL